MVLLTAVSVSLSVLALRLETGWQPLNVTFCDMVHSVNVGTFTDSNNVYLLLGLLCAMTLLSVPMDCSLLLLTNTHKHFGWRLCWSVLLFLLYAAAFATFGTAGSMTVMQPHMTAAAQASLRYYNFTPVALSLPYISVIVHGPVLQSCDLTCEHTQLTKRVKLSQLCELRVLYDLQSKRFSSVTAIVMAALFGLYYANVVLALLVLRAKLRRGFLPQ